jgi:hypothetical protein
MYVLIGICVLIIVVSFAIIFVLQNKDPKIDPFPVVAERPISKVLSIEQQQQILATLSESVPENAPTVAQKQVILKKISNEKSNTLSQEDRLHLLQAMGATI